MDFYLGDAMRKRGLCCRPVFVRHDVTWVDCILQTAEDIVNFFSQPSRPMILVSSFFFDPGAPGTQFQGESLQQRLKTQYTGVGKFCDFRLKSPCISETVRDRPMVATER